MYDFLAHELRTRRDEPVQDRVLYDDVNECFWDRGLVLSLLSPDATPTPTPTPSPTPTPTPKP